MSIDVRTPFKHNDGITCENNYKNFSKRELNFLNKLPRLNIGAEKHIRFTQREATE